jgi:hypothetical protein
LDDVDLGIGRNGIAESRGIAQLAAIDEDCHVLPQAALVIKDVASDRRVAMEVSLHRFPDRRSHDPQGGAGDMTLQIPGEAHRNHGEWVQYSPSAA